MALLPLEASYLSTKEIEEKSEEQNKDLGEKKKEPLRVSRQELYLDVFDSSKLTNIYIIMIVLSAIVAAIGLITECHYHLDSLTCNPDGLVNIPMMIVSFR